MSHLDLPPLDTAAHQLRAQWRDATLGSVWLREGDWYHPAVDALSECLVDGRPLYGAAHRLGEARGAAGVGVGEAIDDVTCLFTAHGSEPNLDVVRAVSVGWAEGSAAPQEAGETVDPWSGLPTSAYLTVRLRETYGAAAVAGTSAARTHALVVVDVLVDGLDRMERLARAAAMGEVMRGAFGADVPTAVASHGVYLALVPRDDRLGDRVRDVRDAVDRAAVDHGLSALLRRPPRAWVQPLPESADELDAFFGSLAP
ncbi:hypothetical protein [Luteimicrobium subarcticum]|uniref:Uncharacterized protein n=1 Tax=Luteimicrobium subarcticum TaxID=620910 RepID=A0A2M8W6R0_9MICO|nr:hypothetical protein [Luteimicrobium subarcticum]PJI86584.1 hypothetical protein CLV34_2503 [Luteimicrobium subarcticum]